LFAICPHFFSNTDPYRVHHYARFSDAAIEAQCRVLAAAADYLAERGRVVFVPMNTEPPDSDVIVQQAIRRRRARPGAVHLIERQYRPREIAGLFSRCRLTLGVRLHSLIMAAAVGCPIVAINYAPKVAGFMGLLGAEADMLDLEGLTFEALRARLDACLGRDKASHALYLQSVDRLRARARHNAELVARLLGAAGDSLEEPS
jgi:polysaccharide pyruvyl transferase WcaK-like protein